MRSSRLEAFIVGMARSGTTWLSKCLHQHPEIAVFGETAFWGRNYLVPENGSRYSKRETARVVESLNGIDVTQLAGGRTIQALISTVIENTREPFTPPQLFERLCQVVGENEGKNIVVEKTPHHVNWVERIASHFPDAKFIVTVRAPYSFMLSYKHQGDRKGPDARRHFEAIYHPVGCAFVYRGYLKAIQRVVDSYEDRSLLIRYADLETRPEAVLENVQKFLGVEHCMALAQPPTNSSFPEAQRPQLSPVDVFWMNMIAGREVTRFGWQVSPSSVRPWAVLKSVASIPTWAFYVLETLGESNADTVNYLKQWLFG